MPEPLDFVVINDGSGLSVEAGKALCEGLDIVIGTLNKRFARHVIDSWLFGGAKRPWINIGEIKHEGKSAPECFVVCPAARRMNKTTSNPGDEKLIVDEELND